MKIIYINFNETGKDMKKANRKKRTKMTIFISIVIGLFVVVFWNQPIYRHYTLTTNKLSNGFTIVHLSDLHSTSYGKNQKRLIKKIDKIKPDLILYTGDIVDDIVDEEAAYVLMKDLATKYPSYYVDGNHEVWHDETDRIYREVSAQGVTILKNTYETVSINGEDIILAGIMDPSERKQKAKESRVEENLDLTGINSLDNSLYTILLTHRPEYYDLYKEYRIDLALAGHAHGGQVRIPFLINGLYAPDQGFEPEHAGGYYDLDSYELIVSRGLSLNPKLPRVINPPEVVVIEVNGGQNEN